MQPVALDLPFRGRWLTQNSPARRVPSHGTDLYGLTYSVDFVPVDVRGRSAPRGWRSWVSVEPPERFVGFGAPILAPAAGTVVAAHNGEPDHEARRSVPALLAYALTQPGRVRQGPTAVAGNHVTIALSDAGPYVTVVHLRRGSVRVRPGQQVVAGEQLGACGNSGNSTEPHVHVQVTDSADWRPDVRGLPMVFRRPGGGTWMPQQREVVDAG